MLLHRESSLAIHGSRTRPAQEISRTSGRLVKDRIRETILTHDCLPLSHGHAQERGQRTTCQLSILSRCSHGSDEQLPQDVAVTVYG